MRDTINDRYRIYRFLNHLYSATHSSRRIVAFGSPGRWFFWGVSCFFPDEFIEDCRSFSPSKTRSLHSPSHLPVMSLVGNFSINCPLVFAFVNLQGMSKLASICKVRVDRELSRYLKIWVRYISLFLLCWQPDYSVQFPKMRAYPKGTVERRQCSSFDNSIHISLQVQIFFLINVVKKQLRHTIFGWFE